MNAPRSLRPIAPFLAAACLAWSPPLTADAPPPPPAEAADAPTLPGFQQLLPRGAIEALVDPDFVSAADAEIPDDAWILGFARDGHAFAYDLNLLNAHEVVNHGIDTESDAASRFAAVW